MYELARRHPDIHVFGLNPGLIKTGIRDNVHGGNESFFGRMLESVIGMFNISAKKYAIQTTLPLAINPELDNVTGKCYNQKGKEIKSTGWVADEKNRVKCWEESAKLVAKV